jgi:hypothetical protein
MRTIAGVGTGFIGSVHARKHDRSRDIAKPIGQVYELSRSKWLL